MTTHFSSSSRVKSRREGALKRLPKLVKENSKRTQAELDHERKILIEKLSGYNRQSENDNKPWKLM